MYCKWYVMLVSFNLLIVIMGVCSTDAVSLNDLFVRIAFALLAVFVRTGYSWI